MCPSRNPTVCNVLHHTSLLYGDEFSYLRSHPERDLPAYEMGIANLLSSRGLKLEHCGKRVALSVVFELIAIDVIVISFFKDDFYSRIDNNRSVNRYVSRQSHNRPSDRQWNVVMLELLTLPRRLV